jgi:phospholipid-binding lipoprotein MlaA
MRAARRPWVATAALAALVWSTAAPANAGSDRTVAGLGSHAPVTSAAIDPDPLFDEAFEIGPAAWDPIEPANRAFFSFNRGVDLVVLDPIARAYKFLVPQPGRRAVRRVFRNLNSPSVFVNDLMQLRLRDAGETLGRFVLNSTVGIGGLFDAGIEAGWEPHHSDFGQTLALWGVGNGPYLVLPLFGPSTTRDGFGNLVDRMFQPLTYFLGFGTQLVLGTGIGISAYEAHAVQLTALEESSVDFYAALRSAYLQNRDAEIFGHLDEEAFRQAAAIPAD